MLLALTLAASIHASEPRYESPLVKPLKGLPHVHRVTARIASPKATVGIIHIKDWHVVAFDDFAADLNDQHGKALPDDKLKRLYAQHLDDVKAVQSQQAALLAAIVKRFDIRAVFVEGLTEARKQFVERETIDRVIETAPDTQWKLIIALARYGGLRCPSEVLALTWADIDWDSRKITVSSPKTRRQGKAFRVIPLFPELSPLLERAFDEASDGSLHVIARYRQPNANLRTQFERILTRAGVEPWERLFQNLRARGKRNSPTSFPCTS